MHRFRNSNAIPSLIDRLFLDLGNELQETAQKNGQHKIKESENSTTITMLVAGHKRKDLTINLSDGKLKIQSNKETEKNKDQLTREFTVSPVNQTFKIKQEHFDTENISAKQEDGILTITLPKKEKEENSQSITIQ